MPTTLFTVFASALVAEAAGKTSNRTKKKVARLNLNPELCICRSPNYGKSREHCMQLRSSGDRGKAANCELCRSSPRRGLIIHHRLKFGYVLNIMFRRLMDLSEPSAFSIAWVLA